MRLVGLKTFLFLAIAVFIVGTVPGCDNPFDPLKSSDKIEGLTYFDFAATQEHWDSDPEWDGVQIVMNYYNEFGDALTFHDKSHKVSIEIWSQTTATPPARGHLLITKDVDFVNSDDLIRIPIEYYGGTLSLGTESIKGCLLVHVYPPQGYPQPELHSLQCDVELFTPEAAI